MVPKYGMGMRFHVTVDGLGAGRTSLGAWSSCKGLQVDIKPIKFREPGHNGNEHLLYADVSYPHIKLERAIDNTSFTALQRWLATQLRAWLEPTGSAGAVVGKSSATIQLCDLAMNVVATWRLRGIRPAGWTGPMLSAKDSIVAMETLELAHEGFLDL